MVELLRTIAPEPRERIEAVLAEKDGEIKRSHDEIARLKEQLAWFQKQLFGRKSERIVADLDESHPTLPGFEMPAETETAEEKETIVYERKKTRRVTGKDKISYPDDLPVERVVIDIPEEKKIDDKTGEPLVCIGEEISRKLAMRSEYFYIKETVILKYAVKGRPLAGVIAEPMPDAILPRCPVDESVIAEIITDKYADHLPIYRVVERFLRSDVKISRQAICAWIVSTGISLEPLYKAMWVRIIESGVIFVDEVPVRLLTGEGKCHQAYAWIYVGGGGGDPPYRYYDFQTGRHHEHLFKALENFSGSVHSDRYGAYEKLASRTGIIWHPCMVHARRKFVELESGDIVFRDWVIRHIRYLFMFERVAWARSPEERLAIRREKEKPILEKLTRRIKERLETGAYLPKSKFREALEYFMAASPYFPNYLDHPDARLDNNVAERAARPWAIGRKNWLFVGSETAGKAAAVLFSLVQTCRNLGVNPREYLEDVLRRLMSHPASRVAELLPDNWLAAKRRAEAIADQPLIQA